MSRTYRKQPLRNQFRHPRTFNEIRSNNNDYLDAIDEDGIHWSAEMDNNKEKWLVYTKLWTKDPQHPINLNR